MRYQRFDAKKLTGQARSLNTVTEMCLLDDAAVDMAAVASGLVQESRSSAVDLPRRFIAWILDCLLL